MPFAPVLVSPQLAMSSCRRPIQQRRRIYGLLAGVPEEVCGAFHRIPIAPASPQVCRSSADRRRSVPCCSFVQRLSLRYVGAPTRPVRESWPDAGAL